MRRSTDGFPFPRGSLGAHEDEPGSWHFVTIPVDLADDIIGEAVRRNAFGSIRVEATIDVTTWRTSLFPDKARGSLLLRVKKEVRSIEDLSDGSPCDVVLSIVD
jgi:hypothetical protein